MSLIVSRPARRRARFHALVVTDVEQLTDQAVALTLGVPEELRAEFDFAPGQHLTLRATLDGIEVRRSYSICTSRGAYQRTGRLRVASARVLGGVMSNWLNDHVGEGQSLEVMTPLGGFTVPTEPDRRRHHVAVAAGSGITPVLSLLTTALEEEPDSQVTLIFGNKRADSVMFAEELHGLKNLYPARLSLITILSQETPDIALFAGRIDRARMSALIRHLVPVDSVDEWYLCGPQPMVTEVQHTLGDHGADPAHVHQEIFHVEDVTTAATPVPEMTGVGPRPGDDPAAVLSVTLDGRTTRVAMATREQSILDATLRERPDAPFSCTGGICGTCRARVVDGEVRMDRNYALEPEEVAAGVILACQAHPVTDTVSVDYDA